MGVLRPPVALAVARDERRVPVPDPRLAYEPKFDFCAWFRPVGGRAERGCIALALVCGVERRGEVEASTAGLLYLHAGWPTAYNSVVVRAAHGYEQTPRDVLAVVCALASRLLTTPGADPITSYRIGSVQVSYGRDGAETVGLTQTEQTTLDQHRLVGVAPAR